jgi:hypothetical protein
MFRGHDAVPENPRDRTGEREEGRGGRLKKE